MINILALSFTLEKQQTELTQWFDRPYPKTTLKKKNFIYFSSIGFKNHKASPTFSLLPIPLKRQAESRKRVCQRIWAALRFKHTVYKCLAGQSVFTLWNLFFFFFNQCRERDTVGRHTSTVKTNKIKQHSWALMQFRECARHLFRGPLCWALLVGLSVEKKHTAQQIT